MTFRALRWPADPAGSHREIEQELHACKSASSIGVLRVVRVHDAGDWRLAAARIDAALPGDVVVPQALSYPSVQALVETVPIDELLRRLTYAFGGGPLQVAEESIPDHGMRKAWEGYRRYATNPDYGGKWPVVEAQASSLAAPPAWPAGTLIAERRSYPNFAELVRRFVGFDPSHDPRGRGTTLVVWDHRARLSGPSWEGGELRLTVEGDRANDALVFATVEPASEGAVDVVREDGGVVRLTAPEGSTRVTVYSTLGELSTVDEWQGPVLDSIAVVSSSLRTMADDTDATGRTGKCTIFYSWQSQLPQKSNRSFIEDALERAVKAIRNDVTVEALPEVDQGAANVPGAPNIADVILGKLDVATAIVFDVSITPGGEGERARPSPNANVLIELGYALKSAGGDRIVLVMNVAYGKPELLPFDLRQRHVVTYELRDGDEKPDIRKKLVAHLETKLRHVLALPPRNTPLDPPAELTLSYRTTSQGSDLHRYELLAVLKNTGKKRLDDWYIEVEMPAPLLPDQGVTYMARIAERSNADRTLLRTSIKDPIRIGDYYSFKLAYRVDNDIYRRYRDVLDTWTATARAFVDGELVAERSLAKMQNF